MDFVKALRAGKIKVDAGGTVKINGVTRRGKDGTKMTVAPIAKRKGERRKANAQARKSRKGNR